MVKRTAPANRSGVSIGVCPAANHPEAILPRCFANNKRLFCRHGVADARLLCRLLHPGKGLENRQVIHGSRLYAGTHGGQRPVARIGLELGLHNGPHPDYRTGHVGSVLHLSRLAGNRLVQRTRKQEGRRCRPRITVKGASTHRRGAFLFALEPLGGRCANLRVTCSSVLFQHITIQEPTDTNSPVHPFKLHGSSKGTNCVD